MVRFSGPWKTLNGAQCADVHRNLSKNYLKLGNNYGIWYRSRVRVRYRVRVRGIRTFRSPVFSLLGAKVPSGNFAPRSENTGERKVPEMGQVVHNCTVYVGLLSLRYRTATYNTNSYDKLSYSCKIRNAVVPFRSGNYTITIKAGTLPVPFRRLSYSCKIRNETQSFRSAVPFRSVPEIITTPHKDKMWTPKFFFQTHWAGRLS